MTTSTASPSGEDRLAESIDNLREQNAHLIEKLDQVSVGLTQLAQYEQSRRDQQQWMDRTWDTTKLLITLAFGLITAATVTVIVTALVK